MSVYHNIFIYNPHRIHYIIYILRFSGSVQQVLSIMPPALRIKHYTLDVKDTHDCLIVDVYHSFVDWCDRH